MSENGRNTVQGDIPSFHYSLCFLRSLFLLPRRRLSISSSVAPGSARSLFPFLSALYSLIASLKNPCAAYHSEQPTFRPQSASCCTNSSISRRSKVHESQRYEPPHIFGPLPPAASGLSSLLLILMVDRHCCSAPLADTSQQQLLLLQISVQSSLFARAGSLKFYTPPPIRIDIACG